MFILSSHGGEIPFQWPVVANSVQALMVAYKGPSPTATATATATPTATVSAPAINSLTINSLGTTATIVFNQAMVLGASYSNAHWELSGDFGGFGKPTSMTYVSGDNTATWLYNFDLPVLAIDDCGSGNIRYNAAGNSIESTLGGTDLPSPQTSGTDFPCTNNSVQ